ncbi:MAG: hypothetical protein ACJA2E_002298 [Arenicella sp.]|jgi:hypothetical protein
MQSLASLVLMNIGGFAVLIALIFHDEIKIRISLMIGAAIILVGFAVDDNLDYWYAAAWAGLIALINGTLLAKVIKSKSASQFTQREKILYRAFKGLQAEEFKDLLKITTWHTPIAHTILTTEDEVCDSLFYILKGRAEVSKADSMFTLNPFTFVGEVGYFLRSAASATTIIEKGSFFVSWKTPALRELEARSPGVRAKIYEVMNKDMAKKVANSQR